ncbi:integrase core domain-containing protein, partial [Burkholderia glumae]|uniref:integrase core domain-containing protein n=1 Tax=Burkholderia glumae TaxID=337 RepID=UPI001FC87365
VHQVAARCNRRRLRRSHALENVCWPQPLRGVVKRPRTIHHSDRGAQYVSIRYSERLADAGIEPSVGSRGDSYDNAPAETINGLYKTELIHRRAPWKTRESVELATLEWVAWYNHCRLMEPLGYIPPAEAEANYYRQLRNAGGVPALP